jgi:hypothetical protein
MADMLRAMDEPAPLPTALLPHLTIYELRQLEAALGGHILVLEYALKRGEPDYAAFQDAITTCRSLLTAIKEAKFSIERLDS